MEGLLVGVDVGTTRIKAVAIDHLGRACGDAERQTPWRRDGAGHAEADPMALADAVKAVCAEAVSRVDTPVLGIGVTGMAETGVLTDGSGRPLAPAIAWHDPRGEIETIARELGTEVFQTTTGLPLTALPSLSKLLWLRRHVPETQEAKTFYSVPEWAIRCLGGAPVSELSLASRTGLFDVARAEPWSAPLDLLGRPGLLSEPVVAGTPVGHATGEHVPHRLQRAVLTVAGHDHQVAAYAVGAAVDGALFDSLGTAEALVRTIEGSLAPERIGALAGQGMSVGRAVIEGHLSVLVGLPTGLTLNRIATMVGAMDAATRAELGAQAIALAEQGQGEGHGQQTTLRLVNPRDEEFGLAGITDGVTPAALWRTAIDAFIAETDAALARIEAIAGPYRTVVAAGGWLYNPGVLEAKRRQFPGMRTTAIAEPGAYGAALMAARAAGLGTPTKGKQDVLQP
ncbi:FGGY-family carbohydrate kinase [Allorhizocola rhizosphaerae]|uniref:FGGY-family carbohydrate kinase n=1 Tax=Allorhizocola rhizosphaerae TaxID=1872709 RepID=UPI0013C3560D|nr:FGGY family carbohydrate kinase [Allorhizocola rhizosphaerae]